MSTVMTPATPGLSTDRKFFTGAALVAAFIVAVGFAPTFYLRPASLGPLDPLLVVHGMIFTSWMLLFIAQTSLIAADRRDLHRKLGVFGMLLAVAIPILGLAAAIHSLRLGHVPVPGLDPRQFFALPVQSMVNFSIFATCALLMRRDVQTHKRLMVLAVFSMLGAALARWPVIGPYGPPAFFAVQDLLIAVALIYDKVAHGHVHKAWKWGAAWYVLSQPLFLALSGSPPWFAFAGMIRGAAG